MMTRRLAAVGLAAVMAHLSLARANVACATHSGHQAESTHQLHQDGGQPDRTPSDAGCEAPSQQECCSALVSCSVVAGVGDCLRVVPFAGAHDRVLAVALSAPLSRVAAPDPPPPRR